MRHLHEGVEGVTSLLRHFSGRQTSAGRERNSDIQHSISHSQSNTTQFQVTIERNTMCVCVSSLAFNTVHSLVVCVQESLVSTTDALLTATLQPLLTSLSSQLALHSALLSQSTASLRAQVGNRNYYAFVELRPFLSQLQCHAEHVSQFVSDQHRKIAHLNSSLQQEASQQVCTV